MYPVGHIRRLVRVPTPLWAIKSSRFKFFIQQLTENVDRKTVHVFCRFRYRLGWLGNYGLNYCNAIVGHPCFNYLFCNRTISRTDLLLKSSLKLTKFKFFNAWPPPVDKQQTNAVSEAARASRTGDSSLCCEK